MYLLIGGGGDKISVLPIDIYENIYKDSDFQASSLHV
jgi:hypothetical protein